MPNPAHWTFHTTHLSRLLLRLCAMPALPGPSGLATERCTMLEDDKALSEGWRCRSESSDSTPDWGRMKLALFSSRGEFSAGIWLMEDGGALE